MYIKINESYDSNFTLHIEFAQNGYNVKATVNGFNKDTEAPYSSKSSSVVANMMNWDQTNKYINPDDDALNLQEGKTVTYTFGNSRSEDCLQSVSFTSYKFDGTNKVPGPSSNSVLNDPLALGETIGNIEQLIAYNYEYVIDTHLPKFYVKSPDKGEYGTVSPGNYLREDDWDNTQSTVTSKGRTQRTFGSGPNQVRVCGFTNFYNEVVVEPNFDDFYYFDSFTTLNAQVYVRDVISSPQGNTYQIYKRDDPVSNALVQYSIDKFSAYAQVLSTDNAEVNVLFKKFPEVSIKTIIGSNLVGRVTPNRSITMPAQRDPNDITRDLIFGGEFPRYSIQPRSFIDKYSLIIDLHKKLERVYLTYDIAKTPIAVYSNASNKTNGITPEPQFVEELQLPDEGQTVNGTSQALKTKLERLNDGTGAYKLYFESIGKNVEVYIDFTPFIVQFFQSITNNITSAMTQDASNNSVSQATTGLNIVADGDAQNVDLTNNTTGITAVYNAIKKVNMNINNPGSKRSDYYIYDIVEAQINEADNSLITANSRINDYYSKLKANQFSYLINDSIYSTIPVVKDMQIWTALEPYKKLQVQFADAGNNFGKVRLLYNGLVNRGNDPSNKTYEDKESQDSQPNTYTEFKPNIVNISATNTTNVAFRRWDRANLFIMPESGYYIKEVEMAVSATDTPGEFQTVLATLPSNEYQNSRTLEIPAVSQNVFIKVDFEELPKAHTFFITD